MNTKKRKTPMTVKQLRSLLNDMPDDATVWTNGFTFQGTVPIHGIEYANTDGYLVSELGWHVGTRASVSNAAYLIVGS